MADDQPNDPSAKARVKRAEAARRVAAQKGRQRAGTVFVVLAFLALGLGRRFLQAMRARRAIARLGGPRVTPSEAEAAAKHARAGLLALFKLLGPAAKP